MAHPLRAAQDAAHPARFHPHLTIIHTSTCTKGVQDVGIVSDNHESPDPSRFFGGQRVWVFLLTFGHGTEKKSRTPTLPNQRVGHPQSQTSHLALSYCSGIIHRELASIGEKSERICHPPRRAADACVVAGGPLFAAGLIGGEVCLEACALAGPGFPACAAACLAAEAIIEHVALAACGIAATVEYARCKLSGGR